MSAPSTTYYASHVEERPRNNGAHPAHVLGKAVWTIAKENGLTFDDLLTLCALLLRSIEKNGGVPVEDLMDQLAKRAAGKVKRAGGAS